MLAPNVFVQVSLLAKRHIAALAAALVRLLLVVKSVQVFRQSSLMSEPGVTFGAGAFMLLQFPVNHLDVLLEIEFSLQILRA